MRGQGHATRSALIAAASQLIPEVGWGSVTTRAVADRAGVRPSLVHYHFDSVEALLVAAAVDAGRDLGEAAVAVLRAADAPAAGADALVAMVTSFAADDPVLLLLTEASLAATRIPALRQAFAAILADLRAAVAQWLTDNGATEQPRATAAVLVAALDGFVLHRAVDPSLRDEAFAAGLRRLVAGGQDHVPPQ